MYLCWQRNTKIEEFLRKAQPSYKNRCENVNLTNPREISKIDTSIIAQSRVMVNLKGQSILKGVIKMMEIKAIAIELRDMFFEELENLIGKYTRITQEEHGAIKQVLEVLERLEIESRYNTDLESLLQLSKLIQQYLVDTVEFYLWCTYGIGKSITIKEAEEYIQVIQRRGYVEVEGILIYEDGVNLDGYVEELLENHLLTDHYHVKRIISDIDEVIEYWMEGIKIESLVDELKHCSLEELLEKPVEEGYMTSEGKLMMYVELDL